MYCTNEWLVLPPRSSLLHFWDGLYNLFWPSCYPSDLTHKGASVIADFTTLGRSHIYGIPCPFVDSLDPIYIYYTLMFQYYPQKSLIYTYTQLLKPYSCVYASFELEIMYIVKCASRQIFLEFSSE